MSKKFDLDWRQVQRGVPLSLLDEFVRYSRFEMADLQKVVISVRTLNRRRLRQKPLSLDEGDRLARVARLFSLAVKIFGGPAKARRWLTCSHAHFDGRLPLSIIRTGVGGRAVEELLVQTENGMHVESDRASATVPLG
jgi:putative toxin-antitoxin system antitoxin component (TIGR02293 family)